LSRRNTRITVRNTFLIAPPIMLVSELESPPAAPPPLPVAVVSLPVAGRAGDPSCSAGTDTGLMPLTHSLTHCTNFALHYTARNCRRVHQ
jgi:hypothetical protein